MIADGANEDLGDGPSKAYLDLNGLVGARFLNEDDNPVIRTCSGRGDIKVAKLTLGSKEAWRQLNCK
jgi:hypothetical protein